MHADQRNARRYRANRRRITSTGPSCKPPFACIPSYPRAFAFPLPVAPTSPAPPQRHIMLQRGQPFLPSAPTRHASPSTPRRRPRHRPAKPPPEPVRPERQSITTPVPRFPTPEGKPTRLPARAPHRRSPPAKHDRPPQRLRPENRPQRTSASAAPAPSRLARHASIVEHNRAPQRLAPREPAGAHLRSSPRRPPPASAWSTAPAGNPRRRQPTSARRNAVRPDKSAHSPAASLRAPRPPRWTLLPDTPARPRPNPTAPHPQPPRQETAQCDPSGGGWSKPAGWPI